MNNFISSALDIFMKKNGSNITPIQQNYIDILKSGNTNRGEQVAANICNNMGVTREEAVTQAARFFGIKI